MTMVFPGIVDGSGVTSVTDVIRKTTDQRKDNRVDEGGMVEVFQLNDL